MSNDDEDDDDDPNAHASRMKWMKEQRESNHGSHSANKHYLAFSGVRGCLAHPESLNCQAMVECLMGRRSKEAFNLLTKKLIDVITEEKLQLNLSQKVSRFYDAHLTLGLRGHYRRHYYLRLHLLLLCHICHHHLASLHLFRQHRSAQLAFMRS